MVPLGAPSLPSSSARPSSVVLCLKADAFVWSVAFVLSRCSVSIWRWRWFFQLRVLSPSVLEGFRWCSGSRLQSLVAAVARLVLRLRVGARRWTQSRFLGWFSSCGCSVPNKCSVRRGVCLTSCVAVDFDGGCS
ncbi:hypothetical protein Bca4012_004183 [Brassica carinata]